MFEPYLLLSGVTGGLDAHRERATGWGLRGLHGGALANSHAIIPCMYSVKALETIRAYCTIRGPEFTREELAWCEANSHMPEVAALKPVLIALVQELDEQA